MTDQYGVIGHPIKHSKSPLIHQAFARQTGEDLSYVKLLGNLSDFPRSVDDFLQQGGRGLNVTVPFKEQAWALADELSEAAQVAGAVNTLIRLEDGRLRGDNTDGVGLVRDLMNNHDCGLQGKRILLLGSGGASKGVLRPLLAENPSFLMIANRTASKAHDLAKRVDSMGSVAGCGLADLQGESFDVVINGTAAGLSGSVPDLPEDILANNAVTYDMMYGDEPTAFVNWGLSHGATKALDGLGMLVEQAAQSFYLWRGVCPDTAEVIALLR